MNRFFIVWTLMGTYEYTHVCISTHTYFLDICRRIGLNTEYFMVCVCVCFGPQGELEYQLQDQDNVVFISTLHGG